MQLRTHPRSVLLLVVLMFVILPVLGFGQTLTTGDVVGTVYDPSHAVVPNVTLTLKSLDTGASQTTESNSVGFFTFKLLKPGRYELNAKAAGFADIKAAVLVNLGQSTTADLTMPLSKTAEVVEVTGVAPVVTQTASVNTSFTQLEVQEMPTAGGDITNIAQTSPGSVPNGQGGYGNFTINGMPATSNLFTINGENDMDPYFNINNSGATNLTLGNNEVQEATVVTNPYGGEYGQLAGAQVTYVTKSGSNQFHGNAQYWWNGRYMNANNWFNNNSGQGRPFSNANQWAASAGGPILKNKTFFFVNTEGLRFVLPNVIYTIVPTQPFANAVLANIANVNPAELPAYQAMFKLFANAKGASAATPISGGPGSDPWTASGGCGDLNPADPEATPVLMPLPGFNATTTPCAADYYATPTGMSKQWILSFRVDQNIGNNDKAFFRYRMDRGLQPTTLDPISTNFNATSNQPAWDAQVQETHIFNSRSTNAFTAAVSHYVALFNQNPAAVASTGFPFGFITSGTSVNFGWDMGGVYGFNEQHAFPQGRNFTQYQFIDDFALIHGNHALKFGANFHRYDVSDHNFFYSNPRVYFDYGAYDAVNGNSDGMQQFVNGWGYQYRQADNPVGNVPIALWYLGAYAQDEWSVRHDLKLTFALRMERNSNPVCNVNCFSNFTGTWNSLASVQAALTTGKTAAGAVPYTSDIRYGRRQVYPGVDAVNLSPRFGFSWSPYGNNSLVISGGVGLFYDSPPTGLADNILANPPASTTFRIRTAGASPVLNGTLVFDPGPNGAVASYSASAAAFATGFPAGQSYSQIKAAVSALGGTFSPPAFNSIVGTLHAPQWQEWNVQVQKELNRSTAIVIGYVGNHGVQIPYSNAWPNAYDPYGVFPGIVRTSSLESNYGTVTQYKSGAISNYNGLTISVKRQLSQWIAGHFNYTWSHNLDEASNGGVFTYGDSLLGQINPFNLRTNNYGNSDYDARHTASADFVFTPKPHVGGKLMSRLVGDWTFSGKLFYHSGLPFTVTDDGLGGLFTNGGGAYLAYPIVGGPTPGLSSCGRGNAGMNATSCLDPAAFFDITPANVAAYPGWSGERRNQYRGPSYFDMDLNLFKNFNILEKATLSIGMSAFNALNHPNFNNPNSALNGSNFGEITGMVGTPTSPYGTFLGFDSSPRVVQLSAKVTF